MGFDTRIRMVQPSACTRCLRCHATGWVGVPADPCVQAHRAGIRVALCPWNPAGRLLRRCTLRARNHTPAVCRRHLFVRSEAARGARLQVLERDGVRVAQRERQRRAALQRAEQRGARGVRQPRHARVSVPAQPKPLQSQALRHPNGAVRCAQSGSPSACRHCLHMAPSTRCEHRNWERSVSVSMR
jgi:hypothetical protein